MDEQKYMTLDRAAEYLGVTKRYFADALVRGGLISIYQITPRKRVVATEDLEKYIQSCRGRLRRVVKGGN